MRGNLGGIFVFCLSGNEWGLGEDEGLVVRRESE